MAEPIPTSPTVAYGPFRVRKVLDAAPNPGPRFRLPRAQLLTGERSMRMRAWAPSHYRRMVRV